MFKTVQVYSNPMDAYLFRAYLEGQGLTVFVHDDITITTNPLYSNALGGVKVKVYENDFEQAQALLTEYTTLQKTENGEEIYCPNCGSTDVILSVNSQKDKLTWLTWLISIFLMVFPFYQKKVNRCGACFKEWHV